MSVIVDAIPLPGYYTVPEVASLLKISRQAVHKKLGTKRPPEEGGLGTTVYKIYNSSKAEEGVFTRPIYLLPADVVQRAIAYQQRADTAKLATLSAD